MELESIFQGIVKRETDYTRLLCNMLKRNKAFQASFFRACNLFEKEIGPSYIASEKRLQDGHGQADILIDSPSLCLIIEVKTELHRGKQQTQEIEIKRDKKTYLGWLKERKTASPHKTVGLVFLIPSAWVHRAGLETQAIAHAESVEQNDVLVEIVLWPQLVRVLKGIRDSLADEFRWLVAKRFGPIGFDSEEAQLMCKKEFPVAQIVKLVCLIESLRKSFGQKKTQKLVSELYIDESEVGFKLDKPGDHMCSLFIGLWPDLWKDEKFWGSAKKPSPICFGIKSEENSEKVRNAFSQALRKLYEQETFEFEDYYLGYVPQDDLQTDDAVESLKYKLQAIWDAMFDVG